MTVLPAIHRLWSFRNVIICSILIRVGLIVYSEWHDARSVLKYTDVDYRVFSDAARFILTPGPANHNRAQGPLKEVFGYKLDLGDPYSRETYRYTPLLALLATPNEWIHQSFVKYLFAACDIINGLLIYSLLVSTILPSTIASTPDVAPSDLKRYSPSEEATRSTISHGERITASSTTCRELATLYSAIHLLNPMVFSISTRGSSESILSLLVLLTLYAAMTDRWNVAAVMLGVSTHWKIYPAIYGVACLGVIGGGAGKQTWRTYLRTLVNQRTIKFGLISVSTFAVLTGGCYLLWGYPFLYEAYIYHLHRLDHRHNFSPYFYLTYLRYPSLVPSPDTVVLTSWSKILSSSLTSFVPQMALALGSGLVFGQTKDDLVFTWFVQTVVFVVFNKVCTSQYFLWYLLLLPLLLPRLGINLQRSLLYLGVWIATQALWLAEGYQLEFLGKDVYYGLWLRGLVYVAGNCWVLGGIMDGYKASTLVT